MWIGENLPIFLRRTKTPIPSIFYLLWAVKIFIKSAATVFYVVHIGCLRASTASCHLNSPISPTLPLVSIQIELLKDTVANHPPSDCPDSPRRRHHLPVVLSAACCLEQRCPVPLRAEHDCMLGCLASSPTAIELYAFIITSV